MSVKHSLINSSLVSCESAVLITIYEKKEASLIGTDGCINPCVQLLFLRYQLKTMPIWEKNSSKLYFRTFYLLSFFFESIQF